MWDVESVKFCFAGTVQYKLYLGEYVRTMFFSYTIPRTYTVVSTIPQTDLAATSARMQSIKAGSNTSKNVGQSEESVD